MKNIEDQLYDILNEAYLLLHKEVDKLNDNDLKLSGYSRKRGITMHVVGKMALTSLMFLSKAGMHKAEDAFCLMPVILERLTRMTIEENPLSEKIILEVVGKMGEKVVEAIVGPQSGGKVELH